MTPKPEPVSLPTDEELWGLFVVGLRRNVQSKLAGLYADTAGIPRESKSRGSVSVALLIHLVRFESVGRIVQKLKDPTCNSEKQGAALIHDLALAFVLVEVALHMKGIVHERPESTLASSALLGDAIPLLRRAWHRLAEYYPEKVIGDLTADEVNGALGSLAVQIQEKMDWGISKEGKARRLKQVREFLTVFESLKIFNFLVLKGLDERKFEDFLGQPGSDGDLQ